MAVSFFLAIAGPRPVTMAACRSSIPTMPVAFAKVPSIIMLVIFFLMVSKAIFSPSTITILPGLTPEARTSLTSVPQATMVPPLRKPS